MKEGLKNVGYIIVWVGMVVLLTLIGLFVLKGAVWVGEHALQWLINFSWILLAINLLILLPLGLFKKTGVVGGIGIYMSSYVCLLYTSPSPRDRSVSRMPSSA